jgi:hypothetical protein
MGNVTKADLDRLMKNLKVDEFDFFIERCFIVV